MALTPDDVQAIGQLLDQRMALHSEAIAKQLRDQERRRRRFWSWVFWITILLTVGSSVWGYYWLKAQWGGLITLERQFQQGRTELAQTRIEYDRLLAHDQAMQKERAEATAASGYKSGQTTAQFDANLLAKTFSLLNRTNETASHLQKQAKTGGTDPDEQSLQELGDSFSQASSLLMQLMLHETDPAHQGSAERMASGEQPASIPIQQPSEPHAAAPAALAPQRPTAGIAPARSSSAPGSAPAGVAK